MSTGHMRGLNPLHTT